MNQDSKGGRILNALREMKAGSPSLFVLVMACFIGIGTIMAAMVFDKLHYRAVTKILMGSAGVVVLISFIISFFVGLYQRRRIREVSDIA